MIDIQGSSQTPDLSALLTLSAENADETEALQAIEAITEAQAMFDAVRLRFVNRYATLRGDHKSTQKALVAKQKVSTAQAGSDISLAYALTRRLPRTLDRITKGEMNYGKATQIARATTNLTADKTREIDAALYPSACDKTPRQLSELLRTLIGQVAPEVAAARTRKRAPVRRLPIRRKEEKSWLPVFLASDDVAAIERRLDRIAGRILEIGDERTPDDIRADTIRDLLLGQSPNEVTKQLYLNLDNATPGGIPEQRSDSAALRADPIRYVNWRFEEGWPAGHEYNSAARRPEAAGRTKPKAGEPSPASWPPPSKASDSRGVE
jgi:hypothetical protein